MSQTKIVDKKDIHIYVNDTQHKELKKASDKTGLSISSLLKTLINQYIQNSGVEGKTAAKQTFPTHPQDNTFGGAAYP